MYVMYNNDNEFNEAKRSAKSQMLLLLCAFFFSFSRGISVAKHFSREAFP